MTEKQYIKHVQQLTGVDIQAKYSTRHEIDKPQRIIRAVATYYLFHHFGLKQKVLGLLFKVTYKCISRWCVRAVERRHDKGYKEALRLLDPKL